MGANEKPEAPWREVREGVTYTVGAGAEPSLGPKVFGALSRISGRALHTAAALY